METQSELATTSNQDMKSPRGFRTVCSPCCSGHLVSNAESYVLTPLAAATEKNAAALVFEVREVCAYPFRGALCCTRIDIVSKICDANFSTQALAPAHFSGHRGRYHNCPSDRSCRCRCLNRYLSSTDWLHIGVPPSIEVRGARCVEVKVPRASECPTTKIDTILEWPSLD